MAQRYSKLPSEILANATSLDLKILDIAESFNRYQQVIQETGRPPPPQLSEKQMEEMIKKAQKK